MSPRTGRPIADVRKDVDVKVRIDGETNRNLLAYCKKNGVTRAEAIRQGIHLVLAKE